VHRRSSRHSSPVFDFRQRPVSWHQSPSRRSPGSLLDDVEDKMPLLARGESFQSTTRSEFELRVGDDVLRAGAPPAPERPAAQPDADRPRRRRTRATPSCDRRSMPNPPLSRRLSACWASGPRGESSWRAPEQHGNASEGHDGMLQCAGWPRRRRSCGISSTPTRVREAPRTSTSSHRNIPTPSPTPARGARGWRSGRARLRHFRRAASSSSRSDTSPRASSRSRKATSPGPTRSCTPRSSGAFRRRRRRPSTSP
jgi:hypothetical protein